MNYLNEYKVNYLPDLKDKYVTVQVYQQNNYYGLNIKNVFQKFLDEFNTWNEKDKKRFLLVAIIGGIGIVLSSLLIVRAIVIIVFMREIVKYFKEMKQISNT